MYLHKTPCLLKQFYSELTWNKSRHEKAIYLTFDDGPVPGVTDYVLDQLEIYKAKATFFCVGDNIARNPGLMENINKRNHRPGNHTFNHLNGWDCHNAYYLMNIKKCDELIPSYNGPRLFRPPYGKIKKSQIALLKNDYEIIMWDVLTGDFDPNLRPEKCLAKSISCTRNGSIVIFHDSLKGERNMLYALPRYLEHFSELGFKFPAL